MSAPRADNSDEEDAVDTATLLGLSSLRRPGQPDPMPRLVDLFIQETSSRLVSLKAAVAQRDLRETERLAHAQKGSSGTLGVNQMRSIAQQLERCAASGQADGIDELMDALEVAFTRSREILERLKANPAA